ncbi:MAG: hypothetical protein JWP52_4611 [Rhizobacter sp.]|nr:hypothetical protein [Rhizobacter sp.]
MRNRAHKTCAALIGITVLATGCGSNSESGGNGGGANETFDIVFVGGVSGPLAGITESEVNAVQVAIDQLNAEGGILGQEITLEVLDSKGDPTEAVSVLQRRLAEGDTPDLVRAGLSSTETLALLPALARAGIPSFGSSNSPAIDDMVAYPLDRQVSAKNTRQVGMGAEYAQLQGYERVAVLAAEDASGDGVVAAAEKAYAAAGIKITSTRYNPQEVNLTVAMQRALDSAPGAIYTDCLGEPCARLLAARESVPGAMDVPMFAGTSMAGSAGGPAAYATPQSLENLHVLVFGVQLQRPESEQTDAFRSFIKDYRAEYGDPASIVAAAVSYDGLRMFAAAAEEAGSTDPEAMVGAIDSIDWKAGDFVTYSDAQVDYDGKSLYPVLPNNAFSYVQPSALEGGQYPPVDVQTFESED